MNHSSGALSSFLAAVSWTDLLSLFIRMTLIAMVGTSVLLLLRRASASMRHLIAMAALVSLVALPLAGALLPRVALPILPARGEPRAAVAANPRTEWAGGASAALPSAPEPARGTDVVLPASRAGLPMKSPALALLLTALVAAALLAYFFISLVAAWSTVRRARRIEDPLLRDDLAAACERLGTSREMDLRECSGIAVPVVWGLARPVLLLPTEARRWTREQLRVVFLHEAAHVARRDWVSLLLARLTTSLFWFHPLVWKLARVARHECERSCDDLVLASGERATEYAEHLLAIVRSLRNPALLAGVAPGFAQRSNLEERLAAILRVRQRRGSISRRRLVVTTATAVLLLAGTAAVQVVEAHNPAHPVVRAEKICAPDEGTVDAVEPTHGSAPMLPSRAEAIANDGESSFRAGHEAFQKGDYVRAASSYLAAAAIGYRRPEAFYRAGCALAGAGATDDALTALGAAVEAGFDHMDWMASDHSLDALRSDPRFLALLNPKPPVAAPPALSQPIVAQPLMNQPMPMMTHTMMTHTLMAQRFEVSRQYRKADSKQDEGGESGIALMRAGQYDRAIHAFEEEIRLTGSSNSMYNLACAYALHGDKSAAFEALERAIDNGFENAQHMTQDEDLKLLQDDPRFYRLVRLTQELQLFGNGHGFNDKDDWRSSLPRFERVANEHPKVGRAWSNVGFASLQAGDPRAAAAAYRRALEAGYQAPTMMYNLGCCAARGGDLDGAFQWLDRADKAGFDVGEHMAGDSDLDALRDDPRYTALLDRWDEKMANEHRTKEVPYKKEKSY